ncbi:MAG: hypothetical protein JW881_10885 [Spirochaetales bacterium]|nr:hypothetical protein [Spirochaetales bacterium]
MREEKRKKRYPDAAKPAAFVKKKIMAKDEFHFLLKMQQIRYARNGNVFSLLLFTTRDNSRKEIRKFTDIVKARMRNTDAIGWFDKHSFGVLLHAADSDGASYFAVDIIKKVYENLPSPPYTIFTYPNQWYGGEE